MLKKVIKFTDYDDNEREETFYFNMSKAEILAMEFDTTGGMQKMLEKIIAEKDTRRIAAIFKDLILKSYGEKSPDGKRFIKSPELSEAFSQTEAYSNLYMELATDADAAAAFVNAIMPKDLAEAAAKEMAKIKENNEQ